MQNKEHPIRPIRRAGVPLAAFETADPALTIQGTIRALNGKQKTIPIMSWDSVRGLIGLNDPGVTAVATIASDQYTTLNPSDCLALLSKQLPDDAIVFFHQGHKYIGNETVCQAIWLCRDAFKGKHATLILLCPAMSLPDELKHDVVVSSEPLPEEDEIERIVRSICEDAVIEVPENLPRVVDSLRGLSGFAVEQCAAMSLSKEGIDLESVLERRRAFISQVAGMEIRTDTITFDDIAGYDSVKTAIRRKIGSKRAPNLLLWLDEINLAFSGNAGDLSGTTQDQMGTLLTWFQDRLNADQLSAMMLIGFPGCGKSAIAQAAHNEAQCECVRLDVGACKGSLVGESERRIRQMLKTIDALSKGHIMVIATCNSVAGIPSPFISRFAFGQWFFDLPTEAENKALWKIKRKKYEIPKSEDNPPSQGWCGREIQQCCFLASDMGIPLTEAAQYIAPFCLSGRQEIEMLRNQANGRWISASTPGLYRLNTGIQSGRKFE